MEVYDSFSPYSSTLPFDRRFPMKEKGYVIGCPNPHSIAEMIVGKRIDWSRQKDEFETLADCFGITREGYLSDESPLFSPKAVRDDSGTVYTFTDEEMQERLVDFMEKYAKPEKVPRKRTTKALTRDLKRPGAIAQVSQPDAQISPAAKAGELTQAQKRTRTLDFLLNKTSKSNNKPIRALSSMRMAKPPVAVEQDTDDKPCMPDGIKPNAYDPPYQPDGMKPNAYDPPYQPDGMKPNAYDPPYQPDGMEWRDKGYFFNETARFTDICQKSIGDCYFLSALCSVAFVDSFRIKNTTEMRYKYIDGAREETPWHRIEFYVPEKPVEEGITWWKDKKKTVQSIVVSEEILVSSSTGRNYGACGPKELIKKTSSNKAEADACWPAVYEKAYAKFLEGTTSDYPDMSKTSHIWCGYSRDTLKQILHTEEVESKMLKFLSIDEVLEICRAAYCHPTCASIYEYIKINSKKKETHYSEAGTKSFYEENLGLFIGHEYSLLDCTVIDGTTYVVLRNPHGSNLQSIKKNPKVYHGSWSYDYGEHWDSKYKGSTYRYKGLSGNDDPNASNGIFLLEINEFKRVFSDITYYTGTEFV